MFREKARVFILLDIVFDAVLIAFSFSLAIIARETYFYNAVEISRLILLFREYSWILLLAYPFILISLFVGGVYGPIRFKQFSLIALVVSRSFGLAVLAMVFILFVSKIYNISRLMLIAFGIIGSLMLMLKKFVEISFLQALRQKGLNTKYIVLVAASYKFEEIMQKIRENSEYGLKVVGLVIYAKDIAEAEAKYKADFPVYHGIKGLDRALTERVVDYVLFVDYKNIESEVEKGLSVCEKHGAEAWLKADFFHMNIAKQDVDDLFGTPIIIFRSSPKFSGLLVIKRGLDIIVSLTLLIFTLPLFTIIACAIKIVSRGPVIFAQKRGGLNGRMFTIFKFRTMVTDAEQRKQELARFNELSGPVFKLANDPRVTKLGRLLRRLSLDELPQLINILKGNMSLVGPRPLIHYEVVKLVGPQRRRLRMRPGLTCIWQVKGRSSVDFNKWIEYDLEYIDNWSLGMDFYLIYKTLFVVFSQKGAY